MYRRNKEYIKSNNASPELFVEDQDYSNSELLYKLDLVTEFSLFTITKNEHRIDLISKEIYGDDKYSWILMYVNRISVDELIKGVTLKYIPLDTLKRILSSL